MSNRITSSSMLLLLFFVASISVPSLSLAQGCEWDSLPEPPTDTDVIEVLRYGGFGRPGRTLVRVDVSGQIIWLAPNRCPDRMLVGHLAIPTFDELEEDLGRAVESLRSQPPRPFVSDEHPFAEIVREGRLEPLCQSLEDGIDLDVTLYHDGSKEHYRCVTGALLRFGENVLGLVPDAICAIRPTGACVERMVEQR